MSFYEGPSTDPELVELAKRPPTKIQGRDVASTLRAGRWSGYIRPDVDLPTWWPTASARACCMLGLDVVRHKSSTYRTGLKIEKPDRTRRTRQSRDLPTDADLDKSNALTAAVAARDQESWVDTENDTGPEGCPFARGRTEPNSVAVATR